MKLIKSALGNYEPAGNPQDADCIIGHSFGTSISQDSPNRALSEFIKDYRQDKPVIVDEALASAMAADHQAVDHSVGGPVSNAVGSGVGSWGTLLEAGRYMSELGLWRPLMVAQAHHIGRVAMQAQRLHMEAIIPAGLPSNFDPESEQIWTRSLALWVPREVAGSVVLRHQGKL